MQFLNGFLCTLASENQTPNCEKSLNYIGKNRSCLLPGYFNIRSLPHAIFIPTWLNLASFWLQKPTKIASWRRLGASCRRLGGLLGRLGRVLERLGLILERLGGVLERLGRVLGRLGAENSVLRHPGSNLCYARCQGRSSAWPPGADNI